MTCHTVDGPRRVKILIVHPWLLAALCEGTYDVTSDPIPKDFRVVSAGWDESAHSFSVLIESDEFEEVPRGGSYQVLPMPIVCKRKVSP